MYIKIYPRLSLAFRGSDGCHVQLRLWRKQDSNQCGSTNSFSLLCLIIQDHNLRSQPTVGYLPLQSQFPKILTSLSLGNGNFFWMSFGCAVEIFIVSEIGIMIKNSPFWMNLFEDYKIARQSLPFGGLQILCLPRDFTLLRWMVHLEFEHSSPIENPIGALEHV